MSSQDLGAISSFLPSDEPPAPWAPSRLRDPDAVIDRARGALLGTAIGDALGRPGEGLPRREVRRRYGMLTDYRPWWGYVSGPVGTITDDTQLTVLLAESLVTHDGRFDPDDVARRLVDWLPDARGAGRATVAAVERLAAGAHWTVAGTASAGNGSAMRAAPIGILHRGDLAGLRRVAAMSSVITHRDHLAVAGTIAHAADVAWLSHQTGPMSPRDATDAVLQSLHGVVDPGAVERKPGASIRVRLADRIAELPDMLHLELPEALDHLYNGAFVLESLPAALWCFLRWLDDPERAVTEAASAGRDSDTVASMVGAYVGALHGTTAFPVRWLRELEGRERLEWLGSELARLSAVAR